MKTVTDRIFGPNGLSHMIIACLCIVTVYTFSLMVPEGLGTWALSIPGAVVLLLTSIARANDIRPEHSEAWWAVRRVGFALTAGAAMFVLLQPFAKGASPVSWPEVILIYGVASCWTTTPFHPPWFDYITGAHREDEDGSLVGNFHRRITGEIRPSAQRDDEVVD